MRRDFTHPGASCESFSIARRWRLGVIAGLSFLTALSVLAASCSPSSSSRTVASVPGGHGNHAASSGPPSVAQSDQDFVNFANCMRSHGVDMSDPVHIPGHQGLSIDLPTRDPATNAAYGACEHFIARIEQAKKSGEPVLSASELQALTNYAQCMRGHDIPMLDPTPQGQLDLGNVPGITSDFGRYSPQFRSANSACRHLLPAGVRDEGTGP
jgi:hypothetical protein